MTLVVRSTKGCFAEDTVVATRSMWSKRELAEPKSSTPSTHEVLIREQLDEPSTVVFDRLAHDEPASPYSQLNNHGPKRGALRRIAGELGRVGRLIR